MTDRVSPSNGHRGDPIESAFGSRYGGGNSQWIPTGGDTPTFLAQDDSTLSDSNFSGLSETSSGSSFDVTIAAGEGFLSGVWFARDTQTTVTLASTTNNQTVYAGWDVATGDAVIIGLAGSFSSEDPKTAIWEFDTDGNGVTSATDRRATRRTLQVGDAEATTTFTDPSGTAHSGELADDGDAQPPEDHNNNSHTETYTTASDDVENFATSGAAETVPVSQGGGSLSMVDISRGFDSVDVFTSDGTFDASGIDMAFVKVVGGGGGGAGVSAPSSQSFGGGGGGAGGYGAQYVDLSNDSSISITVGAGGSGGATGSNDGSSGGQSSFGGKLSANAGGGGTSVGVNGSGGSASATISISGSDGGAGSSTSNDTGYIMSGRGGGVMGSGGHEAGTVSGGLGQDGGDAQAYGDGGGGGAAIDGVDAAGGDGAAGVVIVHYDN